MPDNPDQTVVDDASGVFKQVAATLEAIKKVADILNQARSCVIEVDNNTKHNLVKTWDNHSHGGFEKVPKEILPPETADVFGSQSASWSVFTGCQGSINYRGDGYDFFIHWINPFVGSNTAYAFLTGPKAVLYRATYETGNGNQKAHVRFTVSPHPGYFNIVSAFSGLVLDVPGFSRDNVKIQQYPANGGYNQQWQLIPVSDQYYKIKNRHSGSLLDVANGTTENGEWVVQAPDHVAADGTGGDNQLWHLDLTNPNQGIIITNKASNKVLDVPGGATEARTIMQWGMHGGANQRWRLSPLL